MTLPKNVLWFEVLLYLALMLDALSVAFEDRVPRAGVTDQMIAVGAVLVASMILLFAYFVHLAAAAAEELAALGAGCDAGFIDHLDGAADCHQRRSAWQHRRYRVHGAGGGGTVFFLHGRCRRLVRCLVVLLSRGGSCRLP